MLSWLDGPPESPQTLASLRELGVSEHELAAIPVGTAPTLWLCNLAPLAVFGAMPWLHGVAGPTGLDWASLPRVLRELRPKGRLERLELPSLLRQCEAWALSAIAEKRSAA